MYYRSYDFLNPTTRRILDEFEIHHASVFEQAKYRWNNRAREFMREMIRVRLLEGSSELYGSRQNPIPVPIKLVADHDGAFLQQVDRYYPQLDFLEFVRMRAFLTAADAVDYDFRHPDAPCAAFEEARAYAEFVAGRFQLQEVVSTLFTEMFQNSNDIFGCYFLRDSRIEMYYVPLLVFATLRQIDAGALYAVVLAHELAHAYTHVGRDIDGRYWENFGRADPYVAEGLAQYYTERFAQHYPELEPAYRSLLEVQSGPYLAHCKWPDQFDKETVRRTLIETRRVPQVMSLADFEVHLARTQRGASATATRAS